MMQYVSTNLPPPPQTNSGAKCVCTAFAYNNTSPRDCPPSSPTVVHPFPEVVQKSLAFPRCFAPEEGQNFGTFPQNQLAVHFRPIFERQTFSCVTSWAAHRGETPACYPLCTSELASPPPSSTPPHNLSHNNRPVFFRKGLHAALATMRTARLSVSAASCSPFYHSLWLVACMGGINVDFRMEKSSQKRK